MTAIVSFYKSFKDRYNLSSQLLDFVNKLINNPESPGLHVEPIKNAADKRVRTARVTDQYRAVLFELKGSSERQFLLIDVLNHDDAYALATSKKLVVNPINGTTALVEATSAGSDTSTQVNKSEIESRAKQLLAKELARIQAAEEENAAAKSESGPEDSSTSGVSTASVLETPAVAAEPRPAEILAESGIEENDLLQELGLDPLTVELLLQADSLAQIEDYLIVRPAWEHDAVVGLLAGMTVSEIQEDLGLAPVGNTVFSLDSVAADESTDDELISGMQTDAAKMEFLVAPGQEELEAIIDSGSFENWKLFLHPSQRRIVTANHSGSSRVTGGAGTGKTVVVLHRTKHLLEMNPNARVLLTTYTRDLASSLKTQMTSLYPQYLDAAVHGAPGLWISGIDLLVSEVVSNANPEELRSALESEFGIIGSFSPKALDDREEKKLWEEAVQLKGANLPPEKAHPTFLSQEYSTVILTHQIKDEKSYLRVRRAGRGTSLSRAERKAVWATVETFHAKCSAHRRLTFPALAVLGATIVENRGEFRMFDHVLIDEAQDFHAGHWRFLRACAKPGPNDIFIAEDSHQRIYGERLVLAHYGINTRGRASSRLRVNYRTTAQNLSYASAILNNTEWIDSEEEVDSLTGYHSVRQGPAPLVLHSSSKPEEADKIADLINSWIAANPAASIGVLTRTTQRGGEISTQLSERDIPVAAGRKTSAERPVSVMTMHNAKGLEFTHVVLLDVSSEAIPQKFLLTGLAPAEQEGSLQRERALLYVAASRARDMLAVSVVGDPSDLLPESNR